MKGLRLHLRSNLLLEIFSEKKYRLSLCLCPALLCVDPICDSDCFFLSEKFVYVEIGHSKYMNFCQTGLIFNNFLFIELHCDK